MVKKGPASDDDALFHSHSGENRVGRTRPATDAERARSDGIFRADAVLALVKALPADVTAVEAHVAGFIDGYRPVARLRKTSGLSSEDLRVALSMLHNRGAVSLVGVVEEAPLPWADDAREYASDVEATVPKAAGDVIPAHVMREIQSMIDEESASDFDGDKTTETKLPDDDDA